MIANLFGDFVKGKDYSYLPKIVQEGVFLHREIDDFIDQNMNGLFLKSASIMRASGIIGLINLTCSLFRYEQIKKQLTDKQLSRQVVE